MWTSHTVRAVDTDIPLPQTPPGPPSRSPPPRATEHSPPVRMCMPEMWNTTPSPAFISTTAGAAPRTTAGSAISSPIPGPAASLRESAVNPRTFPGREHSTQPLPLPTATPSQMEKEQRGAGGRPLP